MAAVRKPASTEIAVQSLEQGGVDSVLRADPRALPAHAPSLLVVREPVKRQMATCQDSLEMSP